MIISRVNKDIMYSKPSPHLLSVVVVEISSPRKPWEGVKSAGEGDVNGR
jgi:hypothetical protein